MSYQSTKIIELGSCAFRQWRATHSHCRFLHGYQLKAKLWFSGSSLDEKNWVVDFGGLKELKAKLQQVFDHTTTVAADDPELATFQELDRKGIIQLRIMEKGVGIERAAETVFEIANNYVKALTNGRCWVDRVEVFEHEENSAVYGENSVSLATVSLATEDTQIDAVVPTEAPTHEQQQHGNTHTNGARVGSHVSQGMGNPFAGTSWGN
jgi:6-pyruvoyltetrahydropterin/6-carboxytetrahydropterin synthase